MSAAAPIETYKPTAWKWLVFSVGCLAIPGFFFLAPVGLFLAFGNAARIDLYADRIEQHYLLGKSVHRWDEMENIRADGFRYFFFQIAGFVRFDRKTEKTGVAKAVGNVFGGTRTIYPFGLTAQALARRMIQYRALAETGVTDPAMVRRVLAQLSDVPAATKPAALVPRPEPRTKQQTSLAARQSSPRWQVKRAPEPAVRQTKPKPEAVKSTPIVQEGGWFRRDRSNMGGI